MPYADPALTHNPSTGAVAPASWGDAIRDQLEYLARNKPHCVISNNAVQSVNNNTATDLTANTEAVDVGGMHSTVSVTERIVIPASEPGLYRVGAVVNFAGDADGYRRLFLRKNGATDLDLVTIPAVTTQDIQLTGSRLLSLVAGDYITCRVTHTAGAALNCILLNFEAMWEAVA